MDQWIKPGRRREFVLTVLGEGGSYPITHLRVRDAFYRADDSIVYSVVPWEAPNEYPSITEIAWTNLGNVRWWGALAFSIVEGEGFYSFYPKATKSLYLSDLNEVLIHEVAKRAAAAATEEGRPPHCEAVKLHWVKPLNVEIRKLYEALLDADNVLLRGVNCYLKSHLLWRHQLLQRKWQSICTSPWRPHSSHFAAA
jgi:hypothetical protein